MSNQSVKMITSSHELIEFCDYLSKQEWIAIDTEFLREKTYYPQLCLIQIATIEQCACIDPLVLPELTPLQQILNNSNIVKVMHAGRQDLEIFYYLNQQIPQPIFDTQLAAPVLGLAEQIAYGKLISAILDIHLEKGHARTDWSQRPLSPAQLDYAANDVIYLAQAYLKMREQLIKANRMSWLDEEFAALTQVALYENPPEHAWQRIKSLQKLKGQQLTVLQQLASWREKLAKQKNIPRNWICRDDTLFDIALLCPRNSAALKQIRSVNDNFFSRNEHKILELVEQGLALPPLPKPGKFSFKASNDTLALVDALQAISILIAEKEKLNPSLLAPRKALEQFVQSDDQSLVLQGWRKRLLADKFTKFINGEVVLKVEGKKLVTKKINA